MPISMFIYHITDQNQWELAKLSGFYNPADFHKDGFIHCSEEHQVLDVAGRFYSDVPNLLLLRIDRALVKPILLYENLEGKVEKFPHIYGNLNLDAVENILPLVKDSAGNFTFPDFP